jgi:hypothetical protein
LIGISVLLIIAGVVKKFTSKTVSPMRNNYF